MRFFYDCGFIEDGTTIDLVSIGVVGEDGHEFYAVSTEFDPERAGPWVRADVLPKLPSPADPAWRSRERLRADMLKFLTSAPGEVELWAWIAAYDHVALCQLWGAMPALPRALPRFTRELQTALGGRRTPAAAVAHSRRARRACRRPPEPAAVGGHRVGGRRPLSAGGHRIRQVKMLTPPGPTSSPTMMSTMPQMTCLRRIASTPATTSTTARIHNRVAMPGECPRSSVVDPAVQVVAASVRLIGRVWGPVR